MDIDRLKTRALYFDTTTGRLRIGREGGNRAKARFAQNLLLGGGMARVLLKPLIIKAEPPQADKSPSLPSTMVLCVYKYVHLLFQRLTSIHSNCHL